jgi:hypothetical protein
MIPFGPYSPRRPRHRAEARRRRAVRLRPVRLAGRESRRLGAARGRRLAPRLRRGMARWDRLHHEPLHPDLAFWDDSLTEAAKSSAS